jgi:hypothetical protein
VVGAQIAVTVGAATIVRVRAFGSFQLSRR